MTVLSDKMVFDEDEGNVTALSPISSSLFGGEAGVARFRALELSRWLARPGSRMPPVRTARARAGRRWTGALTRFTVLKKTVDDVILGCNLVKGFQGGNPDKMYSKTL